MGGATACCCAELADIAIIGMGDAEGMDERVFATLDLVRNYGDEKWWLYVSTCRACGQNWMVGQEERIHDNYCLKRIDRGALSEIIECSRWPDDFLTYEKLLRLGRDAGQVAAFLNPKARLLSKRRKTCDVRGRICRSTILPMFSPFRPAKPPGSSGRNARCTPKVRSRQTLQTR